ncbi:TlpA family protein disulfide reductase [Nonlabens ulvanivorans]|uniref:TlpA family protein disulfide reductase n=1 Tax=Nonlabens ulvanivorans TaxID=906888 RepID=UPI0037C70705
MKKILSFIFLLSVVQVYGQEKLDLGEKAPGINITEWIANVPENKDLDNKFKVLEFWTTWCGPCLGAVPHMNELVKEFGDEILFLSITNESSEKVNRTLKRMEFLSTVVTDQTSYTQQEYGDGKSEYTVLPMTVLIDDKNIIKWIGQPQMLDRDILESLLDGSIEERNAFKNSVEEEYDDVLAFAKKVKRLKDSGMNYYLELKKVENSMNNITMNSSSLYINSNASIKSLFSELLGTYPRFIEVPEEYETQQFEIIYKNKYPSIDFETHFLIDATNRLNLKWEKEEIITEGYQLSIKDKSKLEKTLDDAGNGRSDIFNASINKVTGVNYTSYSLKELTIDLSKTTRYLISYESNDIDKYDFTIETGSIADIKKSLEYYGITIELGDVKSVKNIFTKL